MAIQTERRLNEEDKGAAIACGAVEQSRAECTDLREPGRENAEASGAEC